MLFIEIQQEWKHNVNIIKYRNIHEDDWYYMYIDIETLNLLIQNFGIISTVRKPTGLTNCDNLSTGNKIKIKYCGANIELFCKNKTDFKTSYLEQDW
jgi:hypothetical protein